MHSTTLKYLARTMTIASLWAGVGAFTACSQRAPSTHNHHEAATRPRDGSSTALSKPVHLKAATRPRSELQLSPPQPESNQNVVLYLTIRDDSGRAVTDLTRSHEQPIHLLMISKDLDRFAHVHPVLDGDRFRVAHRFEAGGEYILVADYQLPGIGQTVEKHRVNVMGKPRKVAPLSVSPRRQRVDGLELTMHGDKEIRASEVVTLHFDAVDAATNEAVTDLEQYLGAKAHFVALSSDGADFVHVHALDTGTPSRVSAHAQFPHAGLYKLWAQLQRHGSVVTVPFVIRVGSAEGDPDENAAANSTGNHAQHAH